MSWAAISSALDVARVNAESISEDFHEQATGYRRAPYEKRCAAGFTVHDDGYLHITQGWSPGTPSSPFVASHFRTPDFIRSEKAIGDLQMHRCVMNELASFDGKLYRSSGLDTLPAIVNDDLVNDHIYSSPTGAAPWTLESNRPPLARECGFLLPYGGYLYSGMGEAYNPSAPPSYHMRQDIYRKAPGGAWLSHTTVGFRRRNFAYFVWNGVPWFIGGADDLRDPPAGADYRTVYADIIRFDANFLNPVNLGDGPFGPGYGRKAAIFNGHVVLIGGGFGNGTFSTPTTFTNQVWASCDPDLHPSTWFRLDDLPEALNHQAVGVLMVNGVETLGVIGGYNNTNYAGGGPIGKIWTLTSLTGTWHARTDSDFWVD